MARSRSVYRETLPETPSLTRSILTIAVYGLLSIVFGLAHILRRAPLSGYDEAAHLDYAWKLAHAAIPFPGSLIDPEILALWSCVGQDNVSLPDCESGAPASAYPAGGENYLMHPPLYYVIPAVLGRSFQAVGLGFLEGARLGSVLWLFVGMALLYAALRAWRVRWSIAAPVGGFLPSVHLFMVASSTVNNDATSIAAGAGALLVAARILAQGRVGVIGPFIVTVLFVSAKVLNAIPFLAVGLAVMIAASAWPTRPRRLTPARAGALFAAFVAGTATVHGSWTVVRSARRLPGWSSPVAGVNTDDIHGLPFDEWLPTLFEGITSVSYGPQWISAANGLDMALSDLVGILLLVAPIAGILIWNHGVDRWYVAVAAVLAMLMLPLVVQLQTFIGSGGSQYFRLISIRYSLATLPLLLAVAAFLLDERRWVRSAWVFVSLALAISLGTIALG